MSKLRYILLLIFGITSQVNIAHAQQVQPYKSMTESEWNDAKKGFSDSLLTIIDSISSLNIITDYEISANLGSEEYMLVEMQDSLFCSIIAKSTKVELNILQNHPKGIVRFYAINALMYKDTTNLFAVISTHLTDTESIEINYRENTKNLIDLIICKLYFPINGNSLFNNPFIDNSSRTFNSGYISKLRNIIYQIADIENYQLFILPNFQNKLIDSLEYWNKGGDQINFYFDAGIFHLKPFLEKSKLPKRDFALKFISVYKSYVSKNLEVYKSIYKNLNDTTAIHLFEYLINSKYNHWESKKLALEAIQHYFYTHNANFIAKLAKHCDRNELINLLQHPSVTVQCCAFYLLLNDSSFNPIPEFVNRLSTLTINEVNDESTNETPTNQIDLLAYWISHKGNTQQKEIVDSLVFYSPFQLKSLVYAIQSRPVKKQFRAQLLTYAKTHPNAITRFEAQTKLAEYKNIADTAIFINHKQKAKKGELPFTLNLYAINKFKHPHFLPYVKRQFHFYLKRDLNEIIALVNLYPVDYFLPLLKNELQQQLKAKNEKNVHTLLTSLLCYAGTPSKQKAKNIISSIFENQSANKLSLTLQNSYSNWLSIYQNKNRLTNLTYPYFSNLFLDYDSLFNMMYDEQNSKSKLMRDSITNKHNNQSRNTIISSTAYTASSDLYIPMTLQKWSTATKQFSNSSLNVIDKINKLDKLAMPKSEYTAISFYKTEAGIYGDDTPEEYYKSAYYIQLKTQKELIEQLIGTTPIENLIQLSNHPNPIVRSLSILAIEGQNRKQITKQHLLDTISIKVLFGRLHLLDDKSRMMVGDFMYESSDNLILCDDMGGQYVDIDTGFSNYIVKTKHPLTCVYSAFDLLDCFNDSFDITTSKEAALKFKNNAALIYLAGGVLNYKYTSNLDSLRALYESLNDTALQLIFNFNKQNPPFYSVYRGFAQYGWVFEGDEFIEQDGLADDLREVQATFKSELKKHCNTQQAIQLLNHHISPIVRTCAFFILKEDSTNDIVAHITQLLKNYDPGVHQLIRTSTDSQKLELYKTLLSNEKTNK
jgi:hypothetical protein